MQTYISLLSIISPNKKLVRLLLHQSERIRKVFECQKSKTERFERRVQEEMATTVGRNIAAPLLFLNLVMYLIVLGFSSWCINRFINGQTNHPSKFFFKSLSLLCMYVYDRLSNLIEVVTIYILNRFWR